MSDGIGKAKEQGKLVGLSFLEGQSPLKLSFLKGQMGDMLLPARFKYTLTYLVKNHIIAFRIFLLASFRGGDAEAAEKRLLLYIAGTVITGRARSTVLVSEEVQRVIP